jgi:hypothetical protein
MASRSDEAGGEGESRPEAEASRIREKRTDESWKEKAREEKEKLSSKPEERPEALPPASFLGLVDELSFRALIALGQVRPPGAEEVYIDLDGASYAIDLLDVLQQKTKGNLGREEEAALEHVLHDIRLLFVHVSRAVAAHGGRDPAGAPPGPAGAAPGKPAGPAEEKPGPKIIL